MRAEDQYHVGIVVDDIEAAKREWSDIAGYVWGTELSATTDVRLPTGTVALPMRLVYSVSLPRVELVQRIPGTVWEPANSGVHHLGFWSDDVPADAASLEARDYAHEASGLAGDGTVMWSYHRSRNGPRIELVTRALEALLAPVWSVPG
jgi:Glyoxalase/Bleomycin resistance protein/Dioxygenase superfamily